jgi:methionine sulfoxide reductase heme-binding subunit
VHLTSSPVDWYVARAAGIAAYTIVTVTVLLGLTMAGKKTFRRWPAFAVEDVHRFAGLLAGTFVLVHVVTVAIDAWLPFSIWSILVPFVSSYRPVWIALGVVAAELLVALAVTNHYRSRLPYRFWRRVHYLNFVVWGAVTLHAVGSGTDRGAPWALALYAAATTAVGAATVWRLTRRRLPVRRALPLAGAAAGAAALLVVGLGAGPLHSSPKPWNAAVFNESLTGHIARLNGVTRGVVSVAGEGNGTQRVLVRADLLLAPQGVDRTSFQMEYLPSGVRCTGKVTSVHNFDFAASCRMPHGGRRFVAARWGASQDAQLSGMISSHA